MSAQASAAAAFQRAVGLPIARRFPEARAVGLKLVRPVRSRARKAPFVVVVLSILSVGLLGLIVMSTVLQAQSFELARLNDTANSLQIQQQSLARDVDRLQSPSHVAEEAIALGMVPNTNPAFLRLADGKVLGKPEAAKPGSNITKVTQ